MFVSEPTVEDTISILRGLKEKYELHHGVRISDSALVSAATLSNRYITDRFLPDKAIDLMDEASARLRMAVDSKPEALDELDRRIIQLKIEREALKKEEDEASKTRLARLETELAGLEEESDAMTQRWLAEKERLAGGTKLKEQLDQARTELETAQRKGDLARAGELAYGVIPDLERRLKDAEAHEAQPGSDMVEEVVTPNHIAQVVSRWTGVPVDKMLEGERDKLLRMEDEVGKRVIGQAEAVEAVSRAVRLARQVARPQPAHRLVHVPWSPRAWAGRVDQGRGAISFRRRDRDGQLDMSSSWKSAVARLIGAPPGYVGYEEGGVLTKPCGAGPTGGAVRRDRKRRIRTSLTCCCRCSTMGG